MDLVTQGLLGATMAQAGAKKEEVKGATLIGFASGMLADADALINSSDDPLLNIEYHRHFSHSLLFIPLGGLIAALLLWPFFGKKLPFKRLYILALLAYSTSGLLDACTSYGTQLLWPFSEERISWSLIAIVDPLFSFTLMAALFVGYRKLLPLSARVGLVGACLYLSLGMVQHKRAQSVALELSALRGHQVERLVVKPTMGNLILWRSLYESGGTFYVDGIRLSPFGQPRIYQGESVEKFDTAEALSRLSPQTPRYQDISRFAHFSSGYVALAPGREDLLVDVRYSLLPTSLSPLWGIDLAGIPEERHAPFVNFRLNSSQMRDRFFSMLLGSTI